MPAGLHATRSATLQAGKDPTGAVGEVDPAVLERFGVSERVAILELDLDELLGREPKPAAWKPVSRHPSSDLDLAFVLRRRRRRRNGSRRRSGRAPERCSSTSSCSTCSGRRSVGEGRRSLAYRLRLQAPDRNLTDADVAEVRRGAVAAATKLGADLRS